jgi:uncharacterized membrane protein YidH (DUF202 family)
LIIAREDLKMLKNRRQVDVLTSVIILAFAGGYIALALDFTQLSKAEPLGSSGFPILLGSLAAFLAVINLVQVVLHKTKDGDKAPQITKRDLRQLVLVTILLGAYFVAIGVIGYCVSTFLFAVAIYWWIGARKPVQIILVALGVVIFIYLLFGMLLSTQLPTGLLI